MAEPEPISERALELLGPGLRIELACLENRLREFRDDAAGLGALVTWSIQIGWRQPAGSKTVDPAGTADPSLRGGNPDDAT